MSVVIETEEIDKTAKYVSHHETRPIVTPQEQLKDNEEEVVHDLDEVATGDEAAKHNIACFTDDGLNGSRLKSCVDLAHEEDTKQVLVNPDEEEEEGEERVAGKVKERQEGAGHEETEEGPNDDEFDIQFTFNIDSDDVLASKNAGNNEPGHTKDKEMATPSHGNSTAGPKDVEEEGMDPELTGLFASIDDLISKPHPTEEGNESKEEVTEEPDDEGANTMADEVVAGEEAAKKTLDDPTTAKHVDTLSTSGQAGKQQRTEVTDQAHGSSSVASKASFGDKAPSTSPGQGQRKGGNRDDGQGTHKAKRSQEGRTSGNMFIRPGDDSDGDGDDSGHGRQLRGHKVVSPMKKTKDRLSFMIDSNGGVEGYLEGHDQEQGHDHEQQQEREGKESLIVGSTVGLFSTVPDEEDALAWALSWDDMVEGGEKLTNQQSNSTKQSGNHSSSNSSGGGGGGNYISNSKQGAKVLSVSSKSTVIKDRKTSGGISVDTYDDVDDLEVGDFEMGLGLGLELSSSIGLERGNEAAEYAERRRLFEEAQEKRRLSEIRRRREEEAKERAKFAEALTQAKQKEKEAQRAKKEAEKRARLQMIRERERRQKEEAERVEAEKRAKREAREKLEKEKIAKELEEQKEKIGEMALRRRASMTLTVAKTEDGAVVLTPLKRLRSRESEGDTTSVGQGQATRNSIPGSATRRASMPMVGSPLSGSPQSRRQSLPPPGTTVSPVSSLRQTTLASPSSSSFPAPEHLLTTPVRRLVRTGGSLGAVHPSPRPHSPNPLSSLSPPK